MPQPTREAQAPQNHPTPPNRFLSYTLSEFQENYPSNPLVFLELPRSIQLTIRPPNQSFSANIGRIYCSLFSPKTLKFTNLIILSPLHQRISIGELPDPRGCSKNTKKKKQRLEIMFRDFLRTSKRAKRGVRLLITILQ